MEFNSGFATIVWIGLFFMGIFAALTNRHLVKKIIGLNIFQSAVFLFYIGLARVKDGTAPIEWADAVGKAVSYDNPLPHTLILTAIVVSVSTTAVALALIVRIYRAYGTLDEDQIAEKQRESSVIAEK